MTTHEYHERLKKCKSLKERFELNKQSNKERENEKGN